MSLRPTAEIRPLLGPAGLSVRPADDPLATVCFGAVGAFARVEPIAREGAPHGRALLTLPVSEQARARVDWTTLRAFAIDPERREFRLMEASGFDRESGTVWAEIDAPGLYGAYGLPSDAKVREALMWLRDLHPMILRERALGRDTFRRGICELILCADPQDHAPGGPCERCLGMEIPDLGLPEFQLLPARPPWRPKLSRTPKLKTCQIVNGPIAFQGIWGYRDIQKIDSPTAPVRTCVPGAAADFLESPYWRPDGGRLAYAVNPSGAQARLETRDAQCGDVKVVYAAVGQIQGVSWNPVRVGALYELAFNATPTTGIGHEIHAIGEDGSNHRKLVVVGTPVGAEVIAWTGIPSYSPDGTHLAFLAALRPPGSFALRGALIVARADGSNPQVVTPPGFSVREPAFWTPDGQALGSGIGTPVNAPYGWHFYPVTNGVPTGTVVAWSHPEIEYFTFSPDGLRVCGTKTTVGRRDDLFVADYDPATRAISRVTSLGIPAYRPSWGAVCV